MRQGGVCGLAGAVHDPSILYDLSSTTELGPGLKEHVLYMKACWALGSKWNGWLWSELDWYGVCLVM